MELIERGQVVEGTVAVVSPQTALRLEQPARQGVATSGLLYDCRACGHATVAAEPLDVLACLACGEEALRLAANCTLLAAR